MKVKPLVENFIKPEYKTESAGGMDIYFQQDVTLVVGRDNVVNLGFAAEVPSGHVALLLPRSGAGIKGIGLRNTVGVIDSDYRGEWIAHIVVDEQGDNTTGKEITFKRGERAIQSLIVPVAVESIEIVDELSETARGAGGFGSTK
ncbi:MAG: dUTP diphosphatase [Ruminobacter sp.]|uniref:dUTP diphosphatase n=1 Tax=Ruminobacter amylophilus TaxID=867 RepID=A0A662ZIQ0_9GAMM|nr:MULTISPECIES: dUTP diphosphatase [Ruminobacter]MBQ3776337.1 dUTP diphosphatase [Ruminobacter sp.]SFP45409.1 dUTP pyrophosphatase [Ruminobacter amylophilus]